jgi:hypothetical protein
MNATSFLANESYTMESSIYTSHNFLELVQHFRKGIKKYCKDIESKLMILAQPKLTIHGLILQAADQRTSIIFK